MVIRLEMPRFGISEAELIDQLVLERQNGINRAFFTHIHPEWQVRVEKYLAECGNPESIAPWPEVAPKAMGDKFRNLYLSPRNDSVQKPILEELRKRTLTYCPACGEDGTPNTLDHYLPKESYPEFAVTPANLFPMCDICQGAKGAKTLGLDQKRLFVHPYFDEFLDTQLVTLVIEGPFNAPSSIQLLASKELSPDAHLLVLRHLRELDIHSRYYRFFTTFYLRLLRLVGQMRAKRIDVLSNIEVFRDMEQLKSINSWGYVFYDGVLNNGALLDYLVHSEDLPDV